MRPANRSRSQNSRVATEATTTRAVAVHGALRFPLG